MSRTLMAYPLVRSNSLVYCCSTPNHSKVQRFPTSRISRWQYFLLTKITSHGSPGLKPRNMSGNQLCSFSASDTSTIGADRRHVVTAYLEASILTCASIEQGSNLISRPPNRSGSSWTLSLLVLFRHFRVLVVSVEGV